MRLDRNDSLRFAKRRVFGLNRQALKAYRGQEGVYEMTWAGNGRALFMYGREVRPGEPYIIWLRIGGHEIF